MFNKYLPFYKQNLRLALPLVLSQFGQVVVQQADIMMVGFVGTTELAAIAFANSIFIFGFILLMGFTMGLTPAIGHIANHDDTSKTSKLLTSSLFINIILALVIMIGLYITSHFFSHMGQAEEVVVLAKPYFYTLIISVFPFAIFLTNKQFAEGMGSPKEAMYITITANVMNIVLNYIFIFGKLGLPAYGVTGAGIATLISRIYMALMFMWIFSRNKKFKPTFSKLKLNLINKIDSSRLIKLGVPISIQMLLEVSAFAFSAVMAGWLGVQTLAAHQVASGFSTMTFMVSMGVGAATTIRVAHRYAERNYKALIMATAASSHIIVAFMGLAGISYFIFRNYLPYFYTQDPQVIAMAATILIAVAIYQIFDGLQMIMISVLRGLGDVKHAMFYSLIAYVFINIPMGYLLAFKLHLGVIGLWIGFIFGLGMASIMFYTRIRQLFRRFKQEKSYIEGYN